MRTNGKPLRPADWTPEQDAVLREMHAASKVPGAQIGHADIGARIGRSSHAVANRLGRLGLVEKKPAVAAAIVSPQGRPAIDDERYHSGNALPAGHPDTWGPLTRGTVLDGVAYEMPRRA